MEGARRGGHDWHVRVCVCMRVRASPSPAMTALPCESHVGPFFAGKNSIESHGSRLPSRVRTTDRMATVSSQPSSRRLHLGSEVRVTI